MASPKHKKSKMRKRQRVGQLEKAILASVQACPNCGGSGNKIRKGTVGICKYCGTAIKVGRDGKIEFLSNDD